MFNRHYPSCVISNQTSRYKAFWFCSLTSLKFTRIYFLLVFVLLDNKLSMIIQDGKNICLDKKLLIIITNRPCETLGRLFFIIIIFSVSWHCCLENCYYFHREQIMKLWVQSEQFYILDAVFWLCFYELKYKSLMTITPGWLFLEYEYNHQVIHREFVLHKIPFV